MNETLDKTEYHYLSMKSQSHFIKKKSKVKSKR